MRTQRHTTRFRGQWLGAILIGTMFGSPVALGAGKELSSLMGPPVAGARLAALRGGFIFGSAADGLKVSFAIQQVAYVNGELVSETHLSVPLNANGASLGTLATSPQVIQIGSGNTFVPPMGTTVPAGLTVLQNTLDNQTIANATIIDATIASRGFLSNLNISNALSDALARARY